MTEYENKQRQNHIELMKGFGINVEDIKKTWIIQKQQEIVVNEDEIIDNSIKETADSIKKESAEIQKEAEINDILVKKYMDINKSILIDGVEYVLIKKQIRAPSSEKAKMKKANDFAGKMDYWNDYMWNDCAGDHEKQKTKLKKFMNFIQNSIRKKDIQQFLKWKSMEKNDFEEFLEKVDEMKIIKDFRQVALDCGNFIHVAGYSDENIDIQELLDEISNTEEKNWDKQMKLIENCWIKSKYLYKSTYKTWEKFVLKCDKVGKKGGKCNKADALKLWRLRNPISQIKAYFKTDLKNHPVHQYINYFCSELGRDNLSAGYHENHNIFINWWDKNFDDTDYSFKKVFSFNRVLRKQEWNDMAGSLVHSIN